MTEITDILDLYHTRKIKYLGLYIDPKRLGKGGMLYDFAVSKIKIKDLYVEEYTINIEGDDDFTISINLDELVIDVGGKGEFYLSSRSNANFVVMLN